MFRMVRFCFMSRFTDAGSRCQGNRHRLDLPLHMLHVWKDMQAIMRTIDRIRRPDRPFHFTEKPLFDLSTLSLNCKSFPELWNGLFLTGD